MAVTFNSATENLVGFDATNTIAFTATGADCYVVTKGAISSTSDKVTGVTCDGVAMTRLRDDGGGIINPRTYVYGLAIGTGSGTPKNVVWTYTAGDVGMNAVVEVYNGVHQSSSVGTPNGLQNSSQGSPISTSITVPAGGMAVDIVARNGGSVALTPGAGQTESGTQTSLIGHRSASSRKADATAMSWTFSGGSEQVTQSVIVLNPVAGATPVITGPSGAVMTGAAGQVNAFSAAVWRSL